MLEVGGSKPSPPTTPVLARSSSGPGRRPFKPEITGSNPVRATTPNANSISAGRKTFCRHHGAISAGRKHSAPLPGSAPRPRAQHKPNPDHQAPREKKKESEKRQ